MTTAAEWQLTLLRPRRPPLDIDSMVESFEWNDESSSLSGNLQCHRPKPLEPDSFPISRAERVRCRVKWGGRSWYELWTMRTKAPQTQVDTNTVSVDLVDDLDMLKGSKRDWSYRKTRHRHHGYTCDEVALLVARRIGVRVRVLAKGKHRFDKLVKKNAYPLDVLKLAYKNERDATGRRFIIRMRDGALEIVPYARNSQLYVLNRQLQQVAVQTQPKHERPFTALTGHAHVGKGKHSKKIRYTRLERRAVARLGYMHQDKRYGKVSSMHDLQQKVHRDLADSLHVDHTAQVTHTGLPFVRRGEGAQLDLPREGFRGHRAFVYVDSANHQVQSGSYTTDFTFTSDDPYLANEKREAKEAKQREEKRRKRQRRRHH